MGIEQERDIARLISMGGLRFKPETQLPAVSWDSIGSLAQLAQLDAIHDVSAGVMENIAGHVEALCKQARGMGPNVRVAIADPAYKQDARMAWTMTVEHQFLKPGALPSIPGGSRIYGPFPAVDSTDQP